eukprot:1184783-Prorocentrum_minimum.AAC.1
MVATSSLVTKPRSRRPKRPSTSIQQSTVDTSIPFSARHFEHSVEYSTYIPCRQTAIGWPTLDSGACSLPWRCMCPVRLRRYDQRRVLLPRVARCSYAPSPVGRSNQAANAAVFLPTARRSGRAAACGRAGGGYQQRRTGQSGGGARPRHQEHRLGAHRARDARLGRPIRRLPPPAAGACRMPAVRFLGSWGLFDTGWPIRIRSVIRFV